MKRTTLAALVSAALLVPLAGVADAAPLGHARENAPAATFEGDNVPAALGDVRPSFYNGQSATVDEFPGIVAGIRSGGTRPEGQTCTGTVVAPRKIVIAAHCADAAGEKSFVYGLDDLADFDGGAGAGLHARVVEYEKHPSYVNFDQLSALVDVFDQLGATRDAARCRHLLRGAGGGKPSRRGPHGRATRGTSAPQTRGQLRNQLQN